MPRTGPSPCFGCTRTQLVRRLGFTNAHTGTSPESPSPVPSRRRSHPYTHRLLSTARPGRHAPFPLPVTASRASKGRGGRIAICTGLSSSRVTRCNKRGARGRPGDRSAQKPCPGARQLPRPTATTVAAPHALGRALQVAPYKGGREAGHRDRGRSQAINQKRVTLRTRHLLTRRTPVRAPLCPPLARHGLPGKMEQNGQAKVGRCPC